MPLFNTVNLLLLPSTQEIVDGDLLIVQKSDGQTSILDFENFVIGPNNASFYGQVASLSANVVSLSSNMQSLTAYNQTQLNSLSTYIATAYNRIYYAAGSASITSGQTQSALITLTNVPVALNVQDITLAAGGSPSSSVNIWTSNLSQSGPAGGYTYTFYVNINSTLSGTFTVLYNIGKPY